MASRGRWTIVGLALAVGLAVLGYRAIDSGGETSSRTDTDRSAASGTGVTPAVTAPDSPFDTRDEATRTDDGTAVATGTSEGGDDSVSREPGERIAAREDVPVDLQSLGREDIADERFEALVLRLSRDPNLLAALIDEFRVETDPARRARLARLLGDVDDPSVTALAVELVYSGDDVARALGLDLLGRTDSGDARDVISGLLSTETDGDVLVGTLTAMAVPGNVDRGEREALAEQVSLLTTHPDPAVRRTSLDILSRWSDSSEHTPLLLDGLTDDDPIVRRTAAYALVGHEDASEDVVRDLFTVVENTDEVERTRRGAILALKGMPLDDERRRRLEELEGRLNLRAR